MSGQRPSCGMVERWISNFEELIFNGSQFRFTVCDSVFTWHSGVDVNIDEFVLCVFKIEQTDIWRVFEQRKCKTPLVKLLVKRTNNNKLAHGVYRKKTHTDRYLNAASHHHPQQKRSLIKTLAHRAETICDDESRPEELTKLRKL
ncbi:hypothetical protein NQ318_012226 [Aromia moschata]|uniref:Helix-turn-helix domain-containing protein n=1 Tax=Aromia moschata TaxID=1265417 RepID=A0AAV8YL79_9CUCU|nr:hypothetical protein NQ318_012226 [Aromia moschata]